MEHTSGFDEMHLYRPDGVTPYQYWHLWPSAGSNASARDMANYLGICLQRGSFDGTPVVYAGVAPKDTLKQATADMSAPLRLELN